MFENYKANNDTKTNIAKQIIFCLKNFIPTYVRMDIATLEFPTVLSA